MLRAALGAGAPGGRLATAVSAAVNGATNASAAAGAGARRTYHKSVVDHFENPRNTGSMDKSDPNVGTGLVGAPACGDVMKLQIRVNDDGEIVDSKFMTFGCGSAIASSSLATEWIKGMSGTVIAPMRFRRGALQALSRLTCSPSPVCSPPVRFFARLLSG
jgi:hypothetical protein